MPQLLGATICDAAQEYGGKISILGGFVSALHAPLGAICPSVFCGRIGFDDDELSKEQYIFIAVRDPEGNEIARADSAVGPFDTSSLRYPELMGCVSPIVPIPFVIEKYGRHVVAFGCNDVEFTLLPLLVNPPEEA